MKSCSSKRTNNRPGSARKECAYDLSHGAVLCAPMGIRAGDYYDLGDAEIVVITAGINERTGKAIDRNDPRGRLLLLPDNAKIYADIVPHIARVAPRAIIVSRYRSSRSARGRGSASRYQNKSGDQLGYVSRHTSFSPAAGGPFGMPSIIGGRDGHWRTRHVAGLRVVVGAHWRRAGPGAYGPLGPVAE